MACDLPNYLIQSRADSTVSKYNSYFNAWCKWAQAFDLKELPAEPIYIALFMLKRIQEGASAAVIESIVYAIKYFHCSVNCEDPCETPVVKNLLEASKRQLVAIKK